MTYIKQMQQDLHVTTWNNFHQLPLICRSYHVISTQTYHPTQYNVAPTISPNLLVKPPPYDSRPITYPLILRLKPKNSRHICLTEVTQPKSLDVLVSSEVEKWKWPYYCSFALVTLIWLWPEMNKISRQKSNFDCSVSQIEKSRGVAERKSGQCRLVWLVIGMVGMGGMGDMVGMGDN